MVATPALRLVAAAQLLGHAVDAEPGLEQLGSTGQQLGVLDGMPAPRLGGGGGGEVELALLPQALHGARDGALAEAVRARQLGLGGIAEEGEAGEAEIALALVVVGMRADGVGVEEVDATVAVDEHADAGADGRGVAGLKGRAEGTSICI